eukprot:GILJ01018125.1.p1 GENE.GILJ01018125.1~~GILJ01018125.1.p1  ORF type:complete len:812 (-),score=140.71 GILJ01018125.1:311-2629(-)
MPLRSFLFVLAGQSCSLANAASTTFTTNSSSYASVSTFTSTGDTPMAAGTYTLCAKADQSSATSAWSSVLTGVSISRQQRFSLGFNTLAAGVSTVVPLLGDLTTTALRTSLSPALTTTSSSRGFAAAAAVQSDATSIISPCQTELNTTAVGSITPVASSPADGTGTSAILYIRTPGRYVVCALTAVNNTMVPVATITVYGPIVSFPTVVAACDILSVTYLTAADASRTSATSMYLYNGACCTQNASLTSAQTLASIPASSSSQMLRTATVDDDTLDVFFPTTAFSLCISNSTFCVGAGVVTFSGSICSSVTTAVTNTSDRGFTGGAATGWDFGRDNIPVTLLVIFFCLLILCLIIICIVCACYRRRKGITPKVLDSDTLEKGGDGDGTDMPMDMGLYTCYAPSVEAQTIQNDEGRFRAINEHQEDEERRQIIDLFDEEAEVVRRLENDHNLWVREQREIEASATKSRLDREVRERERFAIASSLSRIAAAIAEMFVDEEASRLAVEESEDTVRLNIAEMEREMWRYHMDREGQQLQQELESGHFQTQSRRRKLREANDRAFQSINDAAQLQLQQNFSAIRSSNSPSRSRISNAGSNNPNLLLSDEGEAEYFTHRSESRIRSPNRHPQERMYQGTNNVNTTVAVDLQGPRASAVLVPDTPTSYNKKSNAGSRAVSPTRSAGGGGRSVFDDNSGIAGNLPHAASPSPYYASHRGSGPSAPVYASRDADSYITGNTSAAAAMRYPSSANRSGRPNSPTQTSILSQTRRTDPSTNW